MDVQINPAFRENALKMARQRLQDAARDLVTYIKTVKLSRGRRTQGDVLTAGDPPYSSTGGLRQRVTNQWKDGDPNTQQVGVWDYLPGVVQEKGAPNVHRPGGGLMTIPRSEEAIRHMQGGGTARTFPKKMVMIASRGRTGVFFLVEAKRAGSKNAARSIVHFVLADHVTIPPHPWLVPSLNENWDNMLKIMGGG